MDWYGFRPYVPVWKRKAEAARHAAKLEKKGQKLSPVKVEGRAIANTFWGKAWCTHLESYSDFANRLPRGRTYVRNGSVFDLQIGPGKITALVSGSEIYKIAIKIDKLSPKRWQSVRSQCAGQVGSVLELLQGRFDKSVMAILTDRDHGLFPAPAEIHKECSCPDWAGLCKHLAAVLYGVGSRLDRQPELLFVLRQVDHRDLLDQLDTTSLSSAAGNGQKTLQESELADVFGIELDTAPSAPPSPAPKPAKARTVRAGRGTAKSAREHTTPAKAKKTAASKQRKRGTPEAGAAKPPATAPKAGTTRRNKKPR